MNIENILIEHFPRLKCANFFILFNHNFNVISSVRVILRSTEILVRIDNDHSTIIDLESLAVRIQINSLSLLIAKNNLISFRINIASSFCEEILPINPTCNAGTMNQVALNVNPETKFSIICDNCSGPLSNALHFRRVLELPSEQMDSNDWFCHKPSDTNSSCNGQQQICNTSSLEPTEFDLFYGNFFGIIQRNHIINIQINSQRQMIHCKRCLNHIGVNVSESTVKLWDGNIKIIRNLCNQPERLFINSESLFRNFLVIVDRISYDYQVIGRQTIKLLFEARNSNGTMFLFIQTMARNLEIYQMNRESEGSDRRRATMNRVDGIKCLFLCEENTDQNLVKFWQKDVNVVSAQISIRMLDATVEHLHNLSKYVPEQFRMNNGFCLSYLSYGINT